MVSALIISLLVLGFFTLVNEGIANYLTVQRIKTWAQNPAIQITECKINEMRTAMRKALPFFKIGIGLAVITFIVLLIF